MKSFSRLALLASVAFAPALAHAQPVQGFYVGAGAGLNLSEGGDIKADSSNLRSAFGAGGDHDFKPGYAGVLSFGYGFGNGLRLEAEANFRQNSIDDFGGFSRIASPRSANGHMKSYGGMANALYDFNLGLPLGLTPYVGLGAGYIYSNYESAVLRGAGGSYLAVIGSEWKPAVQGIVGASLPIAPVPGLSATLEYRYLAAYDLSVDTNYRATNGTVTRGSAKLDNTNHSILVGLRYAFNAPAAPAPVPVAAPVPPAAAPAPARTYLVFFDFDRADLTDRARQIIAEAAQNSGRVQATRIEVAGHADRSGSPQYNQRLSQRRADAVAAELVRLGVARTAITVQAFGESRPLVPTADGVREP
ncbi:OmpA family protein, partial [Roseomonas sp. GC11]|uniref:OmpA family protein n=1 Tax=Roseomonas sp. GC11 TaxID=2950546 RepID=UPI00210A57E8